MEETKIIRHSPPLPIFIASPEGGSGPYPVVLLFMHKPGLDEPMKIVCRDLAKAGYFTVGFDEYHNNTLKPEDLTDSSVFKDFEMTLNYVKSLDNIDISKLGVIGFCMGGRHVYLSTAKYSEIKATVSFYGFPCNGTSSTNTPIDLVSKYKSPVLGIFGKEDHLFPFTDVEKFTKELSVYSDHHKVVAYDGAGHGFLNPLSELRYAKESAEKAWKETISHFNKYLD